MCFSGRTPGKRMNNVISRICDELQIFTGVHWDDAINHKQWTCVRCTDAQMSSKNISLCTVIF